MPLEWLVLVLACLIVPISARYSRRLATPSNHHDVESFARLFNDYYGICSNPEHNEVAQRHDGYNLDLPRHRPWSVNHSDFFNFVNVDRSFSPLTNRPMCQSAAEVIESISYPVDQMPCQISWYSPAHICEVMHQYSLVWWSGDSLTRHQTQALFMLLKGDLRYGGIPRQMPLPVFSSCGCDGQFSEALLCRQPMSFLNNDGLVSLLELQDLSEFGYCSTYANKVNDSTPFIWDLHNYAHTSKVTCRNSTKPVFVFLQFGLHCGMDMRKCTLQATKTMEVIQSQLGSCMDRVRIVYSGNTVCSDNVVKKYPDQSREIVRDFNHKMAVWFSGKYPQVITLQFWNLTANALDRTSDGFHHLTDVNLIKAVTVLNIMHHMATTH